MSGQGIYANNSHSQYLENWNRCDTDPEYVNKVFDTNSESTWEDSEWGENNDSSLCSEIPHHTVPKFQDTEKYSLCWTYVNCCLTESDSFQQVFLKESLEQVLDKEAKKIQDEAIVRIQKCSRMFLARKKFLRAKTSIHSLQRAIRRYAARQDVIEMHVVVFLPSGKMSMKSMYPQPGKMSIKKMLSDKKPQNTSAVLQHTYNNITSVHCDILDQLV